MRNLIMLVVLALGTGAHSQDYYPAEWMQVQPDGGLTFALETDSYSIGPQDCVDVPMSDIFWLSSSWQRLEDEQWRHIRGSRRDPNRVCGLGGLALTTGDYKAPFGGEYRAVIEIHFQDGQIDRFISHNTVVITVTAVERRSWGTVKSPAAIALATGWRTRA